MLPEKEFLKKFNIDENDFVKSGIQWQELVSIYTDYVQIEHQSDLQHALEGMIKKINLLFLNKYSIRSRVKDPEHLIRKIIKTKIKNPSRIINISNYKLEIQDFTGIRISHNFRDEDKHIYNTISESALNNIIKEKKFHHGPGEMQSVIDFWINLGFETHKNDGTGYTSHHYILEVPIIGGGISYCEIQTRTVFEDAWGEVDHSIRYPNEMQDPIITSFSNLLNKLSRISVELCTFMQDIQLKQHEILVANQKIEEQQKIIGGLELEIKNNKTLVHKDFGRGISEELIRSIERITTFPKIDPIKIPNFDNLTSTLDNLSALSKSVSIISNSNSFLSGSFIKNNINYIAPITNPIQVSNIIPMSTISPSLYNNKSE